MWTGPQQLNAYDGHSAAGANVMVDRETIRVHLVDAGLARVADEIARLVRPCIRIHTTPTNDDEIPVGVSKFGGLPDVPTDFSWPEWNGQPLAFLAQINLATIATNPIAKPLPSDGLISFFYDCEQSTWGFDPKDKGSWRVYFFSNDSLHRTSSSVSLLEHAGYASCGLTFDDGLTFPGWESLHMQALHLTDVERDKYCEFDTEEETESDGHQLLGHPKEIQSEMQLECQLASNGVYCGNPEGYQNPLVGELRSKASQWTLLFQCDSDDNVGWMWGDVGRLYFWITESDLVAQRFENVWMILQCC